MRYRYRRRYRVKRRFIVFASILAVAVIGLIIFFAFRGRTGTPPPGGSASPSPSLSAQQPTPSPSPSPEPTPTGPVTLTITAGGDVMVHEPQLKGARQADGSYDFNPWFEQIKPIVEKSDLALVNLETTISGEDDGGYTGYPRFNSPESLIPALKNAGFDMLTTANNHSFDRKMKGAKATIENIRAQGLLQTGTYASQEEYDTLPLVDIKGVKTAVLAYTYGTNDMEQYVPSEDLPYLIKYLKPDLVLEDIKKAKLEGADLIILVVHWGEEYAREPNSEQRGMAQEFIEAGADIILGSHPHVVQPITRKKVERLDGLDRESLVVYSMGNLISDQRAQYRDSGILVNITLDFDLTTKQLTYRDVSYVPTYVHKTGAEDNYQYVILPAGEYADDASKREDMGDTAGQRVVAVWNEMVALIGQNNLRAAKE